MMPNESDIIAKIAELDVKRLTVTRHAQAMEQMAVLAQAVGDKSRQRKHARSARDSYLLAETYQDIIRGIKWAAKLSDII